MTRYVVFLRGINVGGRNLIKMAGSGVLYFSGLTSRTTQSQLSRIVSPPIYQSMAIRNWNTTTRLLRMLDEGQ